MKLIEWNSFAGCKGISFNQTDKSNFAYPMVIKKQL